MFFPQFLLNNYTVDAMKKVESIRAKRQALHIKTRLKKGVELRKLADIKEVEKNMSLIKAPDALLKRKNQQLMEVEETSDVEVDVENDAEEEMLMETVEE